MIKETKTSIKLEEILSKISEYDIYRYYLGDFKPNVVFCNPIRKEKNPSFIVGNRKGKWTHKDYGDSFWSGGCFDLVKQLYSVDLFEALKIIDKDFNLNILLKNDSKSIIKWEQPIIEVKLPPTIQVITRPFNKKELDYWKQYGQTPEDLSRENIYVPRSIYRNKKLLPESDLLTFCYFEKNTKTFKIYRPFGESEKNTPIQRRKWDSSIPFNIIENIDSITPDNIVIIVKAKKDALVLKKVLGINSICNVQAEDSHCFSEDTLQYIKNNSKRQIIVSDNDKKGKEFSWWLTKEHGYIHCNVPENIPNKEKPGKFIKDFAELYIQYGEKVVLDHFKEKGII